MEDPTETSSRSSHGPRMHPPHPKANPDAAGKLVDTVKQAASTVQIKVVESLQSVKQTGQALGEGAKDAVTSLLQPEPADQLKPHDQKQDLPHGHPGLPLGRGENVGVSAPDGEMAREYKKAQEQLRHERNYHKGDLNLDKVESDYHPAPVHKPQQADTDKAATSGQTGGSVTGAAMPTYGGPPSPLDRSAPEARGMVTPAALPTYGGPPLPLDTAEGSNSSRAVKYGNAGRGGSDGAGARGNAAQQEERDWGLQETAARPNLDALKLELGPTKEQLKHSLFLGSWHHDTRPDSRTSAEQRGDQYERRGDGAGAPQPLQSIENVVERVELPAMSPGPAKPRLPHHPMDSLSKVLPHVRGADRPGKPAEAVRSRL